MNPFRHFLCLMSIVVFAGFAQASELRSPDTGLNPIDVVAIQLEALRMNDKPYSDAGIAQTWAFAHPDNKRITGPLERFSRMLKSDPFRILIDHKEHAIEPVAKTETEALFAVRVVATDGREYGYRWNVSKVISGTFAGAWMTSAVSNPVLLGEGI